MRIEMAPEAAGLVGEWGRGNVEENCGLATATATNASAIVAASSPARFVILLMWHLSGRCRSHLRATLSEGQPAGRLEELFYALDRGAAQHDLEQHSSR